MKMSRVLGYLFVFAFLSGFVGIGVATIGYGTYGVIQAKRAATWPTTQAEIEACKTQSHQNSKGSSYACEVDYHYQVDGNSYHGDRIAFGYSSTNYERPHKQIERHLKKGRYVQVHYNPQDPSQSVLSTGTSANTWLPIVFGTTWLTICGAIWGMCFCSGTVAKLPSRLNQLNHPSAITTRQAKRALQCLTPGSSTAY